MDVHGADVQVYYPHQLCRYPSRRHQILDGASRSGPLVTRPRLANPIRNLPSLNNAAFRLLSLVPLL